MSFSTRVSCGDRSYCSRSIGQVHGPSSAFLGGTFLGPHWARAARRKKSDRSCGVRLANHGPVVFASFFLIETWLLMPSSPLASVFVAYVSEPCQRQAFGQGRDR